MPAFSLTSSFLLPFPSPRRRHRTSACSILPIACRSSSSPEDKPEDLPRLLRLTATLTVLASSLSTSPVSAAERKRPPRKSAEALSPEQAKAWSSDLPVVNDRIAYTEILRLRGEGRLKHLVKLSSSNLRQRGDAVLVVLDDSRVVRAALPGMERDERFWGEWDRLGLNSLCVNAYTPPVKRPEAPKPFLGFLAKVPMWTYSLVKKRPKSNRLMEFERRRKELVEARKADVARAKEEREMLDGIARAQKKMDEKRKRMAEREMRKATYEESVRQASRNYLTMGVMWHRLAQNQTVVTAMGFFFFYLFYRVVVLNYRKQKKDYDDRMKIEEAENEEKKKMRQLERELAGVEAGDVEVEDSETEKNPYMKMAMQFMQSGARVRRAHSRKLPQYMERGNDVKFSDVAGLGKIRLELEEVVKFFTHGEMYRRRGVQIPGGILLCGPPGVGKTLLAKAVAGEAGVNFFSISASQFVEIYVGVGASRVRALYQEARENAPSVVFIDELDAVGRERGLIKGSGGQERDATLNQLLVCLDGFEGRGNVITIAATNRPDILDSALVRPGRFDRKIFIPKPGMIGRVEILQVHTSKKSMVDDIDYAAVASITDGMVGAELANIIEVAAINIMRDGRSEITTDDLLQAAQIEERGMLDKKDRSLDMWKHLALNEAAMAVVAVNFPDIKNIEFITISPRAGRELGYVRVKMDHMKFTNGMLSRQSLLDHITVQVAPRAADEIWYGEEQMSTIWAETADNARSAARSYVLGGLSEKYHGLSEFWVTDRLNDIDLEALKVLNICYNRAKEILQRNKILMDSVVESLVQKKSLTKLEFFQLVEEHGRVDPPPLSILDIRINKRAEFQEMMMARKSSRSIECENA